MASKTAITMALAKISTAFRVELTKAETALWGEHLGPESISDARVLDTADYFIRAGSPFAPKISEFVARCEPGLPRELEAEKAWQELMSAALTHGCLDEYQGGKLVRHGAEYPGQLSPQCAAVARLTFGTWGDLQLTPREDLQWRKKEFIRLYGEARDSGARLEAGNIVAGLLGGGE